MRARGSAHASLLLSSGTSTASIGWYVAASLALHVLFFVIVTYLPDLAPKREFVPSVIMVNMVTMSPTGTIGKPGHPGPETPGPKSEKPGCSRAKARKARSSGIQTGAARAKACKAGSPGTQTSAAGAETRESIGSGASAACAETGAGKIGGCHIAFQ